MDLLFSKYASPFLLLENYILIGRFTDFVLEFIDLRNEETLWEFYLHKVVDKGWEEFKRSVNNRQNVISEEQLETTVQDSKSLLNNFIPQK